MQLLRANAEAQRFALQGMEREKAMGEQLLQAKAQVAELRVDNIVMISGMKKFASLQCACASKQNPPPPPCVGVPEQSSFDILPRKRI